MGKITMHKLRAVGDSGGDGTDSKQTVRGNIKAIHVVHEGTSAATTDITITDTGISPASSQTILELTDNTASAWYYPRRAAQTTAGVNLTYDGTEIAAEEFTVNGKLTLTVAQQTDGEYVTVYVLVEEF